MQKTVSNSVKIGLIILAIGLLIGALIGYARSVSSTLTISPGVYPGAPSYTVWMEGSNYFAKDANGMIAFSGTNASQIISLASVGSTKILISGDIAVSSPIILPSNITIEIQGSLTLADNANCNIFNLVDVGYVQIFGGKLDGNKAHNTAGIGIYINTTTYTGDLLHHISDIHIDSFTQHGIKIEGESRAVFLRGVSVYGSDDTGFYIGGGDHHITNCLAGQNTGKGFYFGNVGGNQVSNCKAFGTKYNTTDSFGDGFLISGVRNILTNCYAQENDRHGFLVYSSLPSVYGRFNSIVNCIGESNNFNGSLGGAGIRLDGVNSNSVIGGLFTNMIGAKQEYGIWLANASADNIIIGANCLNNRNVSFVIDAAALGNNNTVKNNLGFITDNAGSAASCVNGTVIAHGLAGTPTTITLAFVGQPYINSTCWLLTPTIIASNSTTFTLAMNISNAGTIMAVAAPDAGTIMWNCVYKP